MREYWTSEVEDKLAEYVRCDDSIKKNKIFDDYLHTPFKKLINDVLKRYKPYTGEVDEEIKIDILCYLVTHIERFNPEVKLKSGNPTGWSYSSILIRSWIADYRMKMSREKKNVRFEECHEIHLNKIN